MSHRREQNTEPEYPMLSDLNEQDKQALRQIAEGAPFNLAETKEEWSDDHLPCIGVMINNIAVSFWWLGSDEIGAFYYRESSNAEQMIRTIIRRELEED